MKFAHKLDTKLYLSFSLTLDLQLHRITLALTFRIRTNANVLTHLATLNIRNN